MTDQDPAFMWETEALRSSPQRTVEDELDEVEADPGRWVTLRSASRATGIPVETLRKWARRGTIPTFLQPTNLGTNLRLVDLEGVEQRATELGRPIAAEPTTNIGGEPAPGVAEQTSGVAGPAPPGTMIVPVDAWNKMLSQLGNLHEAGQQLADARERAAKAETEARFLRERLAELRRDSDVAPRSTATESSVAPQPAASPSPVAEEPAPPEKVWHYLIRRARAGRMRDSASG